MALPAPGRDGARGTQSPTLSSPLLFGQSQLADGGKMSFVQPSELQAGWRGFGLKRVGRPLPSPGSPRHECSLERSPSSLSPGSTLDLEEL